MASSRIQTKPGDVYTRWTVIEEASRRRKPCGSVERMWLCECTCGTRRPVSQSRLRRGETKSCGCWNSEVVIKRSTKHGQARRGTMAPEYLVLQGIIQRCTNPSDPGYKNYGGRGITICDQWRHDPAAFMAYIGPRPSSKHSLDREKNSRGYEPSNVRWATREIQNRNTRANRFLTIGGQTKTVGEWAELSGVKYSTILARANRGWPPDRIIE